MTILRLPTGVPMLDLPLPSGRWHGGIWVTDHDVDEPGLYPACVEQFPRSGLWPVLIPHDERFAMGGEDWIVDRGFHTPTAHLVDGFDPGAVLASWWGEPCCDGTCLAPFDDRFPGLVRASSSRADPYRDAADLGRLLAATGGRRLGLVPAQRPADVPAALGWTGAINSIREVAELSAVLRSWEDRFGAVLVTLGFDVLHLAVACPPTTPQRALRLAAEHRAFCRYNFTQQTGNLRQFAATLVDTPGWRFWWD